MAAERNQGVEAEREANSCSRGWSGGPVGGRQLGPTEIRVVLILLNAAIALGLGLDFQLLELNLTVFDVIGLGIVAVMLALLSARVFGDLRELAEQEPAASRR